MHRVGKIARWARRKTREHVQYAVWEPGPEGTRRDLAEPSTSFASYPTARDSPAHPTSVAKQVGKECSWSSTNRPIANFASQQDARPGGPGNGPDFLQPDMIAQIENRTVEE